MGVKEVTARMLIEPAKKYGDTVFQRAHNWNTPGVAPPALSFTVIEVAEFHTDVADVLERAAGLVTLGEEHDAAIMKAAESPDTLGIFAPVTAIGTEVSAGMAGGFVAVMVLMVNVRPLEKYEVVVAARRQSE